jgi:hypothetical protein
MGCFLVFSLIILLGLTIAYYYLRKYRSSIAFFATFLAAIAAILQLQVTAAQNREDVRIKKVAVAFAYFDTWNKDVRPHAGAIMGAMHEIEGKPGEEANQILTGNPEKRHLVLSAFDFFEEVSLAVKTGYVDEASLCEYFSRPSAQLFSMGQVWLKYWRQTSQQTGAYEQYEWLYKRWEKGCPKE